MRFRPLLNAYGVEVEILPFFLGGAREAAGNPFEPTPKYKEAFAKQDSELTGEILGLKIVRPKEFPILSLFVCISIHAVRLHSTRVNSLHRQFASQPTSKTTIRQRNLSKLSPPWFLDTGVKELMSQNQKGSLKH